ncbi:hypothetical protein FA13DRAFT_1785694 [Coprinellus micaceus]|uniref:Uncharacterized protein n=1 Tax=Coprinellus micaceus TaxID=71717 RepID=A0A4Y7TUD6_COPMI|nr:hypothetical protein FA13DRAFT_1785694 [Coprinellus micaceus]
MIVIAKEEAKKVHAEEESALKALEQQDDEIQRLNEELSIVDESKKTAEALRISDRQENGKEIARLVQANTNLRNTISQREAACYAFQNQAKLAIEELDFTKQGLYDSNETNSRLQEKIKKDAILHWRKLKQVIQEKDDFSRQLDVALAENASLTDRLCTIKVEATEGLSTRYRRGGGQKVPGWEGGQRAILKKTQMIYLRVNAGAQANWDVGNGFCYRHRPGIRLPCVPSYRFAEVFFQSNSSEIQ